MFESNKAQGADATVPLGKCEMVVEVPWVLVFARPDFAACGGEQPPVRPPPPSGAPAPRRPWSSTYD